MSEYPRQHVTMADKFHDASMEVALTALSRPAMRDTILGDLDMSDDYADALLEFLKNELHYKPIQRYSQREK